MGATGVLGTLTILLTNPAARRAAVDYSYTGDGNPITIAAGS
ncbi:MAG: hypothetical protein ACHP7D_06950 [Lysobacterales bacterium]